MLNNAFGLLYTSDYNMRLKELTLERTVASVPFGGRYRIIDFPLSNLVNSGVISVAVLTQKNYSSLMDHLGNGMPWDLQRKSEGLRVIPPFANTQNGYYRGTVDAFVGAQDFIDNTPYRYCIYQDCNTVYNINYSDMMKTHQTSNADITMLYSENLVEYSSGISKDDEVRLEVDETDRVLDLEIAAVHPKYKKTYLGCIIIDKQLLKFLIDDAYSHGNWDFMRDVMQKRLSTLRIMGYKHSGYAARMVSTEAFFDANMDILKQEVRASLFNPANPIYTKVKDEVPSLYSSIAIAKNAMAADGCIINGHVENSILGRGVLVMEGAIIKNSVIMQGCEIQENAYIENCILDKDVIVRRTRKLIAPENHPIVIQKLSIV